MDPAIYEFVPYSGEEVNPSEGVYTYNVESDVDGELGIGVNEDVIITSITVDGTSVEIPEKTEDDYYWFGGVLVGGQYAVVVNTKDATNNELTYTFNMDATPKIRRFSPQSFGAYLPSEDPTDTEEGIHSEEGVFAYTGNIAGSDAGGVLTIKTYPQDGSYYLATTSEITNVNIGGTTTTVTKVNDTTYTVPIPADVTSGVTFEITVTDTLVADSSQVISDDIEIAYTYAP